VKKEATNRDYFYDLFNAKPFTTISLYQDNCVRLAFFNKYSYFLRFILEKFPKNLDFSEKMGRLLGLH